MKLTDTPAFRAVAALPYRNPVTHDLKTWPAAFDAVWDERKFHEVRSADRDFLVGDILELRRWDPDTGYYSGRWIRARVTYLTKGGTFGLPENVCVMSIELVECGALIGWPLSPEWPKEES